MAASNGSQRWKLALALASVLALCSAPMAYADEDVKALPDVPAVEQGTSDGAAPMQNDDGAEKGEMPADSVDDHTDTDDNSSGSPADDPAGAPAIDGDLADGDAGVGDIEDEPSTDTAADAGTAAKTPAPRGPLKAPSSTRSSSGSAYAVLTDEGELVFFRSTNSYSSRAGKTVTDLNGTSYTGTVYANVENYHKDSNYWEQEIPWRNEASQIKSVRVADGQLIKPKFMYRWFYACSNLENCNLEGLDTSASTNMSALFSNCSKLSSVDLSGFNTSGVTSMNEMFKGCSSLTAIDLSSFDSSKVESMRGMFDSCSSLTSLNLSSLETGSATEMQNMFSGCTSLASITFGESWSTASATNISAMFKDCSSLTSLDLSNWDVTNVRSIDRLFSGCTKLSSISLVGWKPNMIYGTAEMLLNCTSLESLDLAGASFSGMTTMSSMFKGCSSLAELDLSCFETSQVTYMEHLFEGCSNLVSIDFTGWDTSRVQRMGSMFKNCGKLAALDLSGFDTSSVQKTPQYNSKGDYAMRDMFSGCKALSSVTFGEKFKNTGNDITANADKPVLPTPASGSGSPYTGKWINSTVAGAKGVTPQQLQSSYNGSATTGDYARGTYVWETKPAVTYLPNGGSGTMPTSGGNTISNCQFVPPEGMVFDHWNTEPDDSGRNFYPYDYYNVSSNGSITLNAIWRDPTIGDCTVSAVLDDEGTFTFVWTLQEDVGGPDQTIKDFSGRTYTGYVYNSPANTSYGAPAWEDQKDLIKTVVIAEERYESGEAVYYSPRGVRQWFAGCSNLESVDFSRLDMSSVGYNYSYELFEGCDGLRSVTLGDLFSFINAILPTPVGSNANGKWINSSIDDAKAVTPGNLRSNFDGSATSGDYAPGTYVWAIPATVTFKANGGLGTMDDELAVTDYTIPTSSFGAPAGKAFASWNTEPDGSGTRYTPDQGYVQDDDLTLYAQWFTPTEGSAYAVLTGKGELILLRSMFDYENGSQQEVRDLLGNVYTGTVFAGIERSTAHDDDVPWFGSMDSIKSVSVAERQVVEPKTTAGWFENAPLREVDAHGLDTSGVHDMSNMFKGCGNLTFLDLSELNTSSATNMSNMFRGCAALLNLDIRSFDTGNVTDMGGMFAACNALERVTLGEGFSFMGGDIDEEANQALLPTPTSGGVTGMWRNETTSGDPVTSAELRESYDGSDGEGSFARGTYVRDIDSSQEEPLQTPSDEPLIVKEVWDGAAGRWTNAVSAHVGERLQFRIRVVIPENIRQYLEADGTVFAEETTYVIDDVLPEGLRYDFLEYYEDEVYFNGNYFERSYGRITRNGQVEESGGSPITAIQANAEDGRLYIAMSMNIEEDEDNRVDPGDVVAVYYSATLMDAGEGGGAGTYAGPVMLHYAKDLDNASVDWNVYDDEPHDEFTATEPATTTVHSYLLVVSKIDAITGAPLEGAAFTVSCLEGEHHAFRRELFYFESDEDVVRAYGIFKGYSEDDVSDALENLQAIMDGGDDREAEEQLDYMYASYLEQIGSYWCEQAWSGFGKLADKAYEEGDEAASRHYYMRAEGAETLLSDAIYTEVVSPLQRGQISREAAYNKLAGYAGEVYGYLAESGVLSDIFATEQYDGETDYFAESIMDSELDKLNDEFFISTSSEYVQGNGELSQNPFVFNGGDFSIDGVGAGSFVIHEVKPPEGYTRMGNAVITVDPTMDGDGALTGLSGTVEDADRFNTQHKTSFMGSVVRENKLSYTVTNTKQHKIVFEPNGGTGTMRPVKFAEGVGTSVPGSRFGAPEGERFVGWNTEPDASGTAYAPGNHADSTENIVLYAIWKSAPETIDIAVTKAWDDDDDADGIRPDSIEVTLIANDEPVADTDPITLDERSGWAGVFEGMPKCDDEGGEIVYTVEENEVEGYEAEVDEDGEGGFTITNTHVPENPEPGPGPDPEPGPEPAPAPDPDPEPAPAPEPNPDPEPEPVPEPGYNPPIPSPVIYVITLDPNGGEVYGSSEISIRGYKTGSVLTMPEPTRVGYTFLYWRGSEYYAGDEYTVVEDHAFVAQWEPTVPSEPAPVPTPAPDPVPASKPAETPGTGDATVSAVPIAALGIGALAAGVYARRKEDKE